VHVLDNQYQRLFSYERLQAIAQFAQHALGCRADAISR
jgi:hypothetical protein